MREQHISCYFDQNLTQPFSCRRVITGIRWSVINKFLTFLFYHNTIQREGGVFLLRTSSHRDLVILMDGDQSTEVQEKIGDVLENVTAWEIVKLLRKDDDEKEMVKELDEE